MKLIAELRRRNVIRVAGLYIVGAWLLVQVAETLLPIFDTPGWVLQALVVLLALGLVPALVVAWVFELTPEGIRRDGGAEHAPAGVDRTARKLDIAVIVLLLGLGALMLWGKRGSESVSPQRGKGGRSPFPRSRHPILPLPAGKWTPIPFSPTPVALPARRPRSPCWPSPT